jgi:hypothetical protein
MGSQTRRTLWLLRHDYLSLRTAILHKKRSTGDDPSATAEQSPDEDGTKK